MKGPYVMLACVAVLLAYSHLAPDSWPFWPRLLLSGFVIVGSTVLLAKIFRERSRAYAPYRQDKS